MLSDERRREIATFLRIRRTRRQPEEVGLARVGRRRTPGLRREEVAALAGVSTEWYTWLEQAREVRPSAETLRAIATALRLEPGETRHLLTLAGYGLPASEAGHGAPPPARVSDRLERMIQELEYCPTLIYGERSDILAWNRAATVLYGDLSAMEGLARNSLYQLFVGGRMRKILRNWKAHARLAVGKLRLEYARHVDDPWFNELLDTLRAECPEFAGWWEDHDVKPWQEGRKAFELPELGTLTFDFTVLTVADEQLTALRMVTYVPAPGTGTREALEAALGSGVVPA